MTVTTATHLSECIVYECAKIYEVIAMRIYICITNYGNYIEDVVIIPIQ